MQHVLLVKKKGMELNFTQIFYKRKNYLSLKNHLNYISFFIVLPL